MLLQVPANAKTGTVLSLVTIPPGNALLCHFLVNAKLYPTI